MRAKRSTRKRSRPVRARRDDTATSIPTQTPVGISEAGLNPALQGVDERDPRNAARAPDASIEDPLQDWPEGGASDRDDWLIERGGRRPEST